MRPERPVRVLHALHALRVLRLLRVLRVCALCTFCTVCLQNGPARGSALHHLLIGDRHLLSLPREPVSGHDRRRITSS